jgi:hypothetical protein
MSRFSSSNALSRVRNLASRRACSRASAQDLLQPLLHVLVIALEKLDEQFRLAAEIRMERAARVAGMRGDVFHAGTVQPLLGDDDRAGVEKPLPGEIATFLARESATCHAPMLARLPDLGI